MIAFSERSTSSDIGMVTNFGANRWKIHIPHLCSGQWHFTTDWGNCS